MATNTKKYKIIETIENDAPFGSVNWCTISFLTPQKKDELKFFDVKGFKVHNGFNTAELASSSAKKTKEAKPSHDIYMCEMGKLYGWDDATKTDEIEYGDEKLNELEKTRKENIDKIKLMGEQFKNEYKTLHANTNSDRLEQQRKRLQKKLYDRGLITQSEYEMITEENKPVNEIKDEAAMRDKINAEMEEASATDYLDENEPTALKFGCMTIFSPKHIGGLKQLCFKVRGLFQTPEELQKRINKLKSLYPNDRIYQFEIGKWFAFSENDRSDGQTLLKQLNYAMKCHIEGMDKEKEEFDKRKENLKSKTEQESKLKLADNRREKRRAKRDAKKKKAAGIADNQPAAPAPAVAASAQGPVSDNTVTSMGNPEEDDAIRNILNYLDDPELHNRFPADKSNMETMEVDVTNG